MEYPSWLCLQVPHQAFKPTMAPHYSGGFVAILEWADRLSLFPKQQSLFIWCLHCIHIRSHCSLQGVASMQTFYYLVWEIWASQIWPCFVWRILEPSPVDTEGWWSCYQFWMSNHSVNQIGRWNSHRSWNSNKCSKGTYRRCDFWKYCSVSICSISSLSSKRYGCT